MVARKQATFAPQDCEPCLFDGSPAIALSFTQPLDSMQDFGTLATGQQGALPTTADDGKKTLPAGAKFQGGFRGAPAAALRAWVTRRPWAGGRS